ncbi:TPA: RNA 3'-terminal phosphate cyclase [Pseudomonas aeruginosa]|nr:RNA 3'-terminal phosphate cyclase [Pseudomonas aeruginosa]
MRKDLIELDGSEGGGQILRSALSLSMTSGQPLRIRNIRGRRSRPGLLRQHLTAVRAAAEICAAEVEGAELGSRELAFRPGAIRAGDYAFAIGSAGSCSLVLQTLLPALLAANGESRVRISGGTHNPLAPPADFLRDSWLPLLQRMGAEVDLELLRHGFVPAGGGELLARVRPARWRPLQLEHPGAALRRQARALLAGIPGHVGERELERVRQRLGWSDEERQLEFLAEDQGPGNALLLRIDCEHICATFCAFGQAGKPVSFDNMALAIEAYEATLVTPDSPFDLYLKGDDKALDAQQKKGLKAFMDSGCSACHNGINLGGQAYFPFGLVKKPDASVLPSGDKGRFAVTKTQSDEYVFRAAPLRNVALTAPYFHSGQVWELKDAVAIMGNAQLGKQLAPDDVENIVAFLHSLSGKQPRVEYPLLPASTETTPRPAE